MPWFKRARIYANELCLSLLYRDPKLNMVAHRIIMEAIISFTERSEILALTPV